MTFPVAGQQSAVTSDPPFLPPSSPPPLAAFLPPVFQIEVTCNPYLDDRSNLWNVETHINSRLPNETISTKAPSFFATLKEVGWQHTTLRYPGYTVCLPSAIPPSRPGATLQDASTARAHLVDSPLTATQTPPSRVWTAASYHVVGEQCPGPEEGRAPL